MYGVVHMQNHHRKTGQHIQQVIVDHIIPIFL